MLKQTCEISVAASLKESLHSHMNYRYIYNVEAELSEGQKGTNSRDEGQGKRWEGRMRGKMFNTYEH